VGDLFQWSRYFALHEVRVTSAAVDRFADPQPIGFLTVLPPKLRVAQTQTSTLNEAAREKFYKRPIFRIVSDK
jgi:hypothetical protein